MTVAWPQDAEEHVLGVAVAQGAAEKVVTLLRPEHFYRDVDQRIWDAVTKMVDHGEPVDPVTVDTHLMRLGDEDARHRAKMVGALFPTVSNVEHYCGLVISGWAKRETNRRLLELQKSIDSMPVPEMISALEEVALDVAQSVEQRHEEIVGLGELSSAFFSRMESPLEDDGVPAPFPFLKPLVGGRLYVLGGYQGDGKTAAMMQFVEAAAEAGKRVNLYSIEMSAQDIYARWVVSKTGLDFEAVRTGQLIGEEQERAAKASASLASLPVKIIDNEGLTVAKLRRTLKTNRCDVAFIDHLHQMHWRDRQHIEDGVRQITALAREHEIPVVLLAQLSRSGDWKNPYPIPVAKSLRESGMIDALASHIWFVWRDRDKETHVQLNDGKFVVAKDRFGRTFSKPLSFEDARWEPLPEVRPT